MMFRRREATSRLPLSRVVVRMVSNKMKKICFSQQEESLVWSLQDIRVIFTAALIEVSSAVPARVQGPTA
jgi:hypothetical protein